MPIFVCGCGRWLNPKTQQWEKGGLPSTTEGEAQGICGATFDDGRVCDGTDLAPRPVAHIKSLQELQQERQQGRPHSGAKKDQSLPKVATDGRDDDASTDLARSKKRGNDQRHPHRRVNGAH